MEKENSKQDNLKIIFSLISLFLMIPPLINGDNSYYRTLFIFLINRVIDMTFKRKNNETVFFVVWSLINQWIGVLACAIAFCSIAPDFAEICKSYSDQINITLFVSAISCVLKEMIVLIVISVKESLLKEKIKSEMKGESL
ncbi:MAG: hypothetical protein J6A08_11250 [Lachnospiraceae bacterium]|nr:hypothetical protein [Lachnospiraceae bacterium]